LGNRYQLPVYCLSPPINMIEERSDEPDGSDPDSVTADPSTGSGSDPIAGGECQLRLRLSTGRDLRLAVRSTDTVGMMKRRLQNQEGVPAATQRWFFSGRPLTDRLRLDQLNISKDYVVQVILSQRPPPEPVTPPGHTAEASVPAVVEGVSAQPQEPTPTDKTNPLSNLLSREELTPALQGNQITVLVKEMKAGNYSCHLSSSGEHLNYTLILVQLEPDNRTVILEWNSPEEGHIHCSAVNYKGSFHCTWKKTQHRSHAALLLIKASRYLDEISCVVDADGSGIQCQDVDCPYKEENNPIHLTIYMHSYSRLEAYTKSFYLREIGRSFYRNITVCCHISRMHEGILFALSDCMIMFLTILSDFSYSDLLNFLDFICPFSV
ncbi:hypothetical protein XENOCAPTIV_000701, partial [Xenoophorus captivus]